MQLPPLKCTMQQAHVSLHKGMPLNWGYGQKFNGMPLFKLHVLLEVVITTSRYTVMFYVETATTFCATHGMRNAGAVLCKTRYCRKLASTSKCPRCHLLSHVILGCHWNASISMQSALQFVKPFHQMHHKSSVYIWYAYRTCSGNAIILEWYEGWSVFRGALPLPPLYVFSHTLGKAKWCYRW